MRVLRKNMTLTKPQRKTPNIHEAAFNGDARELQDALCSGQKVDGKDIAGRTAFHIASANGHTYLMKLLMEFGYDINNGDPNGLTALHHAARNGHLETLKWLISNGADHRIATKKGRLALDVAIAHADRQGQRDVINYLKQCEQEKMYWET